MPADLTRKPAVGDLPQTQPCATRSRPLLARQQSPTAALCGRSNPSMPPWETPCRKQGGAQSQKPGAGWSAFPLRPVQPTCMRPWNPGSLMHARLWPEMRWTCILARATQVPSLEMTLPTARYGQFCTHPPPPPPGNFMRTHT